MKTGLTLTALTMAFVLLMTPMGVAAAADSGELTLSIGTWTPYIDASLPNDGLLSEIVTKAFAAAGVTTHLEYMPWKRAEYTIDTLGAISFGWIKNKKRLKKWLYSDVITHGTSILAARRADAIQWKELKDLTPYRIGVTLGYSYGDAFDQFKPNLRIQTAYTDEENIEKLIQNKIDLFCVDSMVGAMILKKRFSPAVRKEIELILQPPLVTYEYFVIGNRNSPQTPKRLEQFNQGLAIITQSGEKDRILKRYLSVE